MSHTIWCQVLVQGIDKDTIVLMAARASRLENQDAIDCAIVSMLGDPKEVCNLFVSRLCFKIQALSYLEYN